jgi:hypothetical protein
METVPVETYPPVMATGFYSRPDLLKPVVDEDPDHPFRTLYCVHCGHPVTFEISCGDRTCPKCRRKWFGYHYKFLVDLVKTWTVIHSLTLTTRNIPDNEFCRNDVKRIRDDFTKLRKRLPDILGGFYVTQATNKGRGWHLHLHVVFDGKFIPKERVVRLWSEITGGSFIVDIADVKTPEKAIRYLLADFNGRPRIRPEDFNKYNEIFKGSRLVQPFGIYRKLKIRVPYKCPECGCTSWAFLWEMLSDRHICREEDG